MWHHNTFVFVLKLSLEFIIYKGIFLVIPLLCENVGVLYKDFSCYFGRAGERLRTTIH